MAVFFVVYNQQARASRNLEGQTSGESGKIISQTTDGTFVKVEATSVADAQNLIKAIFPGAITDTPIVVTEAQWKSS